MLSISIFLLAYNDIEVISWKKNVSLSWPLNSTDELCQTPAATYKDVIVDHLNHVFSFMFAYHFNQKFRSTNLLPPRMLFTAVTDVAAARYIQ